MSIIQTKLIKSMKKLLLVMLLSVSVFTYGQSKESQIYKDAYLLRYYPTQKTLNHFKSLKPDSYAISFCIANSKYAQRKEMIPFYKASKPTKEDIAWLKANCEFVRKNW